EGTKIGIKFNFDKRGFSGKLYYGFIPYGDSKHPHPVFFKRWSEIEKGKASIDILGQLEGRYDMIGWAKNGYGTLGFRVMGDDGQVYYDGKVSFSGTGPFEVVPTVIEGPFLHRMKPTEATIAFTTHIPTDATLKINNQELTTTGLTQHEIKVTGLNPDTDYDYTVSVGPIDQTYTLHTSPEPGTRKPLVFAYASDSRAGQGGGERDIYGSNAYIMKKIMALANMQDAAFFQFSGDLINGYLTNAGEMDLQYANWKRAVEPFGHYFPIYVSMGNHEALMRSFYKAGGGSGFTVDRFPYTTESGEAVFARNFVNPLNGPASEDGASYDPNPEIQDFPSYEENVFYYTYDNVAVVVMNSDYWYAPSTGRIPVTSGGMHGYIMDQQFAWLEKTILDLESNEAIDHIFITQHTPFFPNGGHVSDDMWYNGDNTKRPFAAGKPLSRGIIQRRDQMLDLIVNKSQKVLGILTGDEHNYARTTIGPETQIHPSGYPTNLRVKLSRTIYQINNGAAGAPYYAQETTPWTPFVSGFTTQNALVLFHIEGKSVTMRVMNPDTLEEIEQVELRK
ncbi:MAG: metallophosphoesterase, partial [Bacteroidota bacterium]